MRRAARGSGFSASPDFLLKSLLRSQRDPGLHFLCREKVTKSGRGAPRAPVQGDSHPAGGVGPACRSIRGRIRASTGPLVELWAVLRSERLPEGPGSLGGLGPVGRSVREDFLWRQWVRRSLFSAPPDFLLNRLLRSERKSGLCYFLDQKKVTKD